MKRSKAGDTRHGFVDAIQSLYALPAAIFSAGLNPPLLLTVLINPGLTPPRFCLPGFKSYFGILESIPIPIRFLALPGITKDPGSVVVEIILVDREAIPLAFRMAVNGIGPEATSGESD